MELHQRLKKHMEQSGMSARSLAARLGDVSRITTANWATGDAVPDANQMARLAEVFGVSVGEMYGEEPGVVLSDDEWRLVDLMRTLNFSYQDVLSWVRQHFASRSEASDRTRRSNGV